jgi:hypothetical protein
MFVCHPLLKEFCELVVELVLTMLLFPVSVRGITEGASLSRDRNSSAFNFGFTGKEGGPVLAGIMTFSGNVGPVLLGFKGIGGR